MSSIICFKSVDKYLYPPGTRLVFLQAGVMRAGMMRAGMMRAGVVQAGVM